MLQRQQQRVVRVPPEGQRVGPAAHTTVACNVAVIGAVEHGPHVGELPVIVVGQLRIEQRPSVVPERAQTANAAALRGVQLVVNVHQS